MQKTKRTFLLGLYSQSLLDIRIAGTKQNLMISQSERGKKDEFEFFIVSLARF